MKVWKIFNNKLKQLKGTNFKAWYVNNTNKIKLKCVIAAQCPWLQPVITQLLRSCTYRNAYYFRNTFQRTAAKKLPSPPTPAVPSPFLATDLCGYKTWSQKPYTHTHNCWQQQSSDAFTLEYTDLQIHTEMKWCSGHHKVQHFVGPTKCHVHLPIWCQDEPIWKLVGE